MLEENSKETSPEEDWRLLNEIREECSCTTSQKLKTVSDIARKQSETIKHLLHENAQLKSVISAHKSDDGNHPDKSICESSIDTSFLLNKEEYDAHSSNNDMEFTEASEEIMMTTEAQTSIGSDKHEKKEEINNGITPITNGQSRMANDDEYFYNMNNKHRGVAIIFNNAKFEMVDNRKGSDADVLNLTRCLENLGFAVQLHMDLTYMQIRNVIKAAMKSDYSDSDCFILAVMTHGQPDGALYARDLPYKANFFFTSFTDEKCPSLTGKPRIFIINACLGDRFDNGITFTDFGSAGCRFPFHPDFLIAYSTVPGFYSWRNTETGSWFIESLSKELAISGFKYNLLTILTFVCHRVAIFFESYSPQTPDRDKMKQTPCINSMLTRLLKFTPKLVGGSAQAAEQ